MHLTYSTSKYKGNTYKSYSIAESVRKGNKVSKNIIWPIGKLSEQQAAQIRLICKVVQSKQEVVTLLENIVVKESKSYLDIAVVNDLWNRWKLDDAFGFEVTDSTLPTHTVAKLLTINRCTDPCSHYSIPTWAEKNAIAEILNIDITGLNDDKIYYELDKIWANKTLIENHLFQQTHQHNAQAYEFIDYDLTTAYFVGHQCKLSAIGKGKIECHGRRQVLLGVMINAEGYPFKWDVFSGNTAEVKTLKKNVHALKNQFELNDKNVTLVFDRGIISDENADLLTESELKYISALDSNQIPNCGIDLTPFKKVSFDKKTETVTKPDGYIKYSDDLYFKDHGVFGKKRFVVGFNPIRFKEDRTKREDKIRYFLQTYLKNKNTELKHAKRDRKHNTTKSHVINELKRLKIHKFFEEPSLKLITVKHKLKNGTTKQVKSFQVTVTKKTKVIKADKLLDGVCVFVTNHTERQGNGFRMKPQSIIKAYRYKVIIEDLFKNLKSFLKLRPFFVNTQKHVEAVYTICILSYFFNRYLSNQRKALGERDYLNSKALYAPFKDIDIVTIKDSATGTIVQKAAQLPKTTQNLIQKLEMERVVITQ